MKPTSWRHTSTWLYGVMLVASLVALYVSFVLSAETLYLARHPQGVLGCDVNSVISCSQVAQSWQAEFITFGGLSYPNAFFGIAAEAVFVTISIIGIARIKLPRWFAVATWYGALAALLYAYWLFTQSVFVIEALCPWCLGLMFATTVQFMALTHATHSVQGIGLTDRVHAYYRLHIDLLVNTLWILGLLGIIVIKYGPALWAM